MKTTIGGERLGSGSKMEFTGKHFERSNHDLSERLKTSISPGTLVPFLNVVMLPGDKFDVKFNVDLMTVPTLGPLFGAFKVQVDAFLTPIALYNAHVTMNAVNIGKMMGEVKIPQLELRGRRITDAWNIDNQHVNSSCVLSYLGIRGIGNSGDNTPITDYVSRQFNAIPWLIYWDTYKNYYANKQENVGYYIHNDLLPNDYTIDTVKFQNAFGADISLTESQDQQGGTQTQVWIEQYSEIVMEFTALQTLKAEDIYWSINGQWWPMMSIFQEVHKDGLIWYFKRPRQFGPVTGPEFQTIPWAEITVGYFYVRQDLGDLDDTAPNLKAFELENVDTMRKKLLANVMSMAPVILNQGSVGNLTPYADIFHSVVGDRRIYSKESPLEGLGVKTYQSDQYNNWLDTESIDGDNGVNEVTAIQITDDKIYVDQITVAYKVYQMLNRVNLSGGSVSDWESAVYGRRNGRVQNPMYIGGLSKELIFQEIVSTVGIPEQPLGTMAGKGRLTAKHHGGDITVRADELSYLTAIVSITPRIDYSQGNKWDMNLKSWNDFHKADLDGIGFQDDINDQRAWWDTTIGSNGEVEWTSAGKLPAWTNYTTSVNRVLGTFAMENSEMWMVLNRRYEPEMINGNFGYTVRIKDLTTYVDPAKYNYIFAYSRLDAQNFWMQIDTDIFSRRQMSARQIPNL